MCKLPYVFSVFVKCFRFLRALTETWLSPECGPSTPILCGRRWDQCPYSQCICWTINTLYPLKTLPLLCLPLIACSSFLLGSPPPSSSPPSLVGLAPNTASFPACLKPCHNPVLLPSFSSTASPRSLNHLLIFFSSDLCC